MIRDQGKDKIRTLCEAWWTKLADATKVETHQYASQLLDEFDWKDPEPAPVREHWDQAGSVSYVLRGGGQTSLATHFVMPGALDPPSSLVERGLDFCETTRLLVDGTRGLQLGYAFITDLFRSYLYDVRTDELLLYADTPAAFSHELAGLLRRADIERGALDEVRRQPRSVVARQLREWSHRWRQQLYTAGALMEEDTLALMDRLVVLRFLADHDVFPRASWDFPKRFNRLIAQSLHGGQTGCSQELLGLFDALWKTWKAGFFAPAAGLNAALAKDTFTAPLLREFALLSQTKFTIATVLESFNYGEPAEKARVRMVPEPNADRETYLAKQTVETVDAVRIELNLDEEGYRAVFYWFDELVALYDRLETEFDAHAARRPVPRDLDLLAWAEMDSARPRALVDKHLYAADNALVIYYTTPRQARTARLMLYLHFVARRHQSNVPCTQFPSLDHALVFRPVTREPIPKWARPPLPEQEWEVM